MISAIKKEIFLRKEELEDNTLSSLYFGGGTPSVLKISEIQSLIDEILKYFNFAEDIEITLEANPDDLDKNFLQELSKTEINRLSIGTQSFFDEDLRLMNRAHNASQAEASIKRSQDFGFGNISIDLIYGSPSSDFNIWQQNLQKTLELQVPHVSAYALTIEPKTALHSWIQKGKILPPEETRQNSDFFYMCEVLKSQDFQHYEISNFAKPGFQSQHNSAYWKHRPYLGFGPSAHSYDGNNIRSWNVANNMIYIKELTENRLPKETELLSEQDHFNELIMIGLRTVWGVNLKELKDRFSEKILAYLETNILQKLQNGQLKIEDGHLKIPEEYWFLADGIASDLFLLNA